MSARRRHLLAGAGIAVVVLAVLALAGAGGIAVRTYALDAPNQDPVALVGPGAQVCEGPVTSQTAAAGVGLWGASTAGGARITVDVQDAAGGAILASGVLAVPAVENEYEARLDRPVRGGRPVRICLRGDTGTFSAAGSAATSPDVVMTGKVARGNEFSLVLLSAPQSLLGSLPTAFSRASLWRPDWVGSWTFWVLAAALAGTFGIAALAVADAGSADERPDHPGGG